MTELPDAATYDAATLTIRIGTGTWTPVSLEAFDYSVGGRNVIKSWVNYRKANPTGKKTSPLDDMHATDWPVEWSSEFTELLTVLERLVGLETMQGELLDRLLESPLADSSTLSKMGVQWPVSASHRKVRHRDVNALNLT